jgi:hypothetical protein
MPRIAKPFGLTFLDRGIGFTMKGVRKDVAPNRNLFCWATFTELLDSKVPSNREACRYFVLERANQS